MDRPPADDTDRIVRFMLAKAAVFIGIPVLLAVVIVTWTLG